MLGLVLVETGGRLIQQKHSGPRCQCSQNTEGAAPSLTQALGKPIELQLQRVRLGEKVLVQDSRCRTNQCPQPVEPTNPLEPDRDVLSDIQVGERLNGLERSRQPCPDSG